MQVMSAISKGSFRLDMQYDMHWEYELMLTEFATGLFTPPEKQLPLKDCCFFSQRYTLEHSATSVDVMFFWLFHNRMCKKIRRKDIVYSTLSQVINMASIDQCNRSCYFSLAICDCFVISAS